MPENSKKLGNSYSVAMETLNADFEGIFGKDVMNLWMLIPHRPSLM